MDLEAGLVTFLNSQPGIAGLLGTRLYPLVIPQDAEQPALAYQRIDTPRISSHDGPSGLAKPRIQITVTAKTFEMVKALTLLLRRALDGYRGMWGSVPVQKCSVMNEIDGYAMEAEGAYTVRLDLVVWHEED